ncbi:MAG TPA: 3-phosphoshikimate 1-carboxyvinyltransferase [Syntrophobacteria bacterium]|nr:3-phosphoshikimate 1-carboxyvinyltransferase [Syntrophobacteria bacterium]
MKEVKPVTGVTATVPIPGSKSLTHRALIIASLAGGESHLRKFLECEDTVYTMLALRRLGVHLSGAGDTVIVRGTGGILAPGAKAEEIFLGNSGTSFRLLLAVFALARGGFLLSGTPRMHRRPVGELVAALKSLGVDVSCSKVEGFPPVALRATGIRGGKVQLPGSKSSQFVSALLLAGPYAERGIEIEVTGNLVSRPYVDLTIEAMERFGVPVVREGYRSFRVIPGPGYQARDYTIEGDVSSASYFWAAAAVSGGSITTTNVYPGTTLQGDIGFLSILEQMGCTVERGADRVVVRGGRLSGVEVDMESMPDMVPTLAAVAAFADGDTAIRNVAQLRHKESDRLRAVALEWRRLGIPVEELADGLVIPGGTRPSGAVVDPHDDHRLAMALAVLGLQTPGVRIRDEQCVSKSFPDFWEKWDSLGM